MTTKMTILIAILCLLSTQVLAAEPPKPDKDGCYALDQMIPTKAGEHKVSDGMTFTENVGLIEQWASKLTSEARKELRWCPSRVEGTSQ